MSDRLDLATAFADVRDESAALMWRRIEQDARAHALTVLDAEEAQRLVLGAPVAWVTTMYARTDGLSPIHRVGVPIGDKPHTACHEAIPHRIQHMILSPALLRSMDPCRFCEAEYQRAQRGVKSHAA